MKLQDFEEFLFDSRSAKTGEELFSLLIDVLKPFGYDRINFSIVRDHDLPKDQNRFGLIQNYPADWQSYYAEKIYEKIDPVIQYGAAANEPFTWSSMEQLVPLTKSQRDLMREGEEAGLNNGVVIPLHGGRLQSAGFALATTEKRDACFPNLDAIYAYCNQFYLAFKHLNCGIKREGGGILLTPKEREILNWMSAGKSNPEIAIILGVSPTTITTHIMHIYQKLDVHDRVTCVIKAIMQGIITPYSIPL